MPPRLLEPQACSTPVFISSHPQCTTGQSDSSDWSCKAESEAAAAAGASCPTFTDTSCSGIFAQPPEEGRRTAAYLASLLADMAYEPANGATWEDTARAILPGWGATDVQFISKTRAGKVCMHKCYGLSAHAALCMHGSGALRLTEGSEFGVR